MALPETDLARIRRWCDARVPEHFWDELNVEADITNRHVTIVEVRPPLDGQGEHTRFFDSTAALYENHRSVEPVLA